MSPQVFSSSRIKNIKHVGKLPSSLSFLQPDKSAVINTLPIKMRENALVRMILRLAEQNMWFIALLSLSFHADGPSELKASKFQKPDHSDL